MNLKCKFLALALSEALLLAELIAGYPENIVATGKYDVVGMGLRDCIGLLRATYSLILKDRQKFMLQQDETGVNQGPKLNLSNNLTSRKTKRIKIFQL